MSFLELPLALLDQSLPLSSPSRAFRFVLEEEEEEKRGERAMSML